MYFLKSINVSKEKAHITLIASDLDGTLINRNDILSDRTRSALLKAHENGCLLVVNTGRAQSIVPSEICNLPFSYIITSNGASTINNDTGKVLIFTPIKSELVMSVLNCIDEKPVSVNANIDGKMVCEYRWLRTIRKIHAVPLSGILKVLFDVRHIRFVKSIKRLLKKEKSAIEKVELIFDHATCCIMQLKKLQKFTDIEAVTTSGNTIEITAKGINKGNALTKLCEQLDISKHQVVVFGDSGNDISMRDAAEFFIATGNASNDVKAAAHRITLNAENDGVAVVLEELF